jgi:hypothetical protein
MLNLLQSLSRSIHVAVASPTQGQASAPLFGSTMDSQTLAEFGLPLGTTLSADEIIEVLEPVPECLKDHPVAPAADDIGNVITPPPARSLRNLWGKPRTASQPQPTQPLPVVAEVVMPVTYHENSAIHNLLEFSEKTQMRKPAHQRFRPFSGLGVRFREEDAIFRPGIDCAIPLATAVFEVVLDRQPPTGMTDRVNSTEWFSTIPDDVPVLNEAITRRDFSWQNFRMDAKLQGKLFNPDTYVSPPTLLTAKINQSMDDPRSFKLLPEPEIYLAFEDLPSFWMLIEDALGVKRGQGRRARIQPTRKQLDFVERTIKTGMVVRANGTGVISYVKWQHQPVVDIYVQMDSERRFVGCIPEGGKFYVPEGAVVKQGDHVAAGFPQHVDLDGDGQPDSPAPRFERRDDGKGIYPFLENNGGMRSVVQAILKNGIQMATVEGKRVAFAPASAFGRIIDKSTPELALLVWPHTVLADGQLDDNDDGTFYGVFEPQRRSHGYSIANPGVCRDALVIHPVALIK